MPQFVIHIGLPKTGTTYLQHAFTRLRPELTSRGVLYPDRWGSLNGHFELRNVLEGEIPSPEIEAFVALHRSGARQVLLSSEALAEASDAALRRLFALLAGQPALIVLYCRRWSETIPALWREVVKYGSNKTLPEFTLSCLHDPVAAVRTNFGHVLERWAAVFGHSSIRVASYSQVIDTRGDLFSHFCRNFLDWPDPPASGIGRVNESLDFVEAETLRAVNVLDWAETRQQVRSVADRFMEIKSQLPIRALVERAMQYAVDTVHIDDNAPELAALQVDIASRYRDVLVPPMPPHGLFEPRRSDVPYLRTDYLFLDGAIEMLRDMRAILTRR